MGRSTSCTNEIVALAHNYIDNYDTRYGDEMPSIIGMSLALKVGRSTLYDWSRDDVMGFSDILERCMSVQHQVLFNKGLTNDFNSAIVKLALGKHGYSEKTATEITGAEGGPVQVAKVEWKILPVTPVDKSDENEEDA